MGDKKVLSDNIGGLSGMNYLSESEATAFLKLSRQSLFARRRDRALPFLRVGGRVYYRRQDLQAYLDSLLQSGDRVA